MSFDILISIAVIIISAISLYISVSTFSIYRKLRELELEDKLQREERVKLHSTINSLHGHIMKSFEKHLLIGHGEKDD